MTPFGECLTAYLKANNSSQRKLACRMGMQMSYLSMILHGQYLSHRDGFADQVIECMEIQDPDATKLRQAAIISSRLLVIPPKASANLYMLAHSFFNLMPMLTDKKIAEVQYVLDKMRSDNN